MKTHDYIHCYRGYWTDGGKCRIRIYQEERHDPVVIWSQLLENKNTSVTNMASTSGGGDRGARAGYPPDLDRALPQTQREALRVLNGDVLFLGAKGGAPRRRMAPPGRTTRVGAVVAGGSRRPNK